MASHAKPHRVVPTTPFFEKCTVDDFPFDRDVVVLDGTLSTLAAFSVLASNQILSAPVRNPGDGKYIGFFDVQDMVAYVVETLRKSSEPDADVPDMFADLRELLSTISRTTPNAVDTTANFSKKNPFVPVSVGTKLVDVINVFVTRGIRRVPVMDHDGKIVKLITQNALVQFLMANKEATKPLGSTTVAASGLGVKEVLQVGTAAPALRALELLYQHNVSAIALVDRDDKDRLVAQFCSSDLRAMLSGKKLRFLGITAMDFVQHSMSLEKAKARPPVSVVTADATLVSVFEKLRYGKVHRVFVVDNKETQKPVGIVSIRDALKALLAKVSKPA
eukprot:m.72431 g.72431  ORF g.72431 m.72431 type:complete len:333 (-) comp14249_c1_seq1:98-1096(-)